MGYVPVKGYFRLFLATIMARVNVEQTALADARYEVLARLAGLADSDHARGRMLHVWNACQERGSYTLPDSVVAAIFGNDAAPEWLVLAELSSRNHSGNRKRLPDGISRIRGTKGRIEWLGKARKNGHLGAEHGKKGGRPKKPHLIPRVGLGEKPPPAPALPEKKEESLTPEETRYEEASASEPGSPVLPPDPGPRIQHRARGKPSPEAEVLRTLAGNGAAPMTLDEAIDQAETPSVRRRLAIERGVRKEQPELEGAALLLEISRRFNAEQGKT